MGTRDKRLCLLVTVLLAASGCPAGQPIQSDDDEDTGEQGEADASVGDTADHRDGSIEAESGLPDVDAPERCGDGIVDPDEECDDGNRLDGDDCDWRCRLGRGDPYPWAHDPAVGDVEDDRAWAPIDGATVGVSVGGEHRVPIVWTGSAYATVWIDRAGAVESGAAVRFVRFDTAGRALGPEWSYTFEDRGFSSPVDLAWSGSRFALVWSAESSDGHDGPLSAMILDEAGKRLFGPVTLYENPNAWMPAVAWDGEAFVTVWASDAPSARLGFVRFDDTASILAPPVWIHTGTSTTLDDPVVAASPDAIVVLLAERPWSCGSPSDDPSCWRWLAVDRAGSPTRAPASIGPASGATPGIAWAGDRFGMAVPTGIERCPGVHVAVLDPGGALVAAPVALCTHAARFGGRRGLSIAWGAGGWALGLIVEMADLAIIRTDGMGVPVHEIVVESLRTRRIGMAIAFDGSGFGLVAQNETGPLFARYVVVP